jgi:GAF domain-containing protein
LALDSALDVTSAEYANIQLINLNHRVLESKAHRGFKKSFLNFFKFVYDSTTACGAALLERKPIIVEDVCFSPIFSDNKILEVIVDSGVRSVQSMPLITDGQKILGIISVHYSRPRSFAKYDQFHFQVLSRAIANLIDRY